MSENKDETAGPRPQGLRHGEATEDIEARKNFLRNVQAKVVAPPDHDEPKRTKGARRK